MSSGADDPNLLQTLLAGVAAAGSACAAALFGVTNYRIGKLEGRMDTKADKSSVATHRDDVNNIWGELRELRQDMNDKHIQLLNAISNNRHP